jgi:hypothetical protein
MSVTNMDMQRLSNAIISPLSADPTWPKLSPTQMYVFYEKKWSEIIYQSHEGGMFLNDLQF